MSDPFALTPESALAAIERAGAKGLYVIDTGIYVGPENQRVIDLLRSEGKIALVDRADFDSIDRKVFGREAISAFKTTGLIRTATPDEAESFGVDYLWTS